MGWEGNNGGPYIIQNLLFSWNLCTVIPKKCIYT